MFRDEMLQHYADNCEAKWAQAQLEENEEKAKYKRAEARQIAEDTAAMDEAMHFFLDVRQAARFHEPVFRLEQYPPLVWPNIFVEFNGLLRFNYSIPKFTTGVGRSVGALTAEPTPPDMYGSPKDALEYRGCLIRCLHRPHFWANYPDEPLVRIVWLERKAPVRYERDGKTFFGRAADNYSISFSTSSWPRLLFPEHHRAAGSEAHAERLFRMSVNLLYFLSAENLTFVRVAPEHRERRGKELKGLPKSKKPYYVLPFQLPRYQYQHRGEGGSGRQLLVCHDVRGHFRHLRDERFHRNPDGSIRIVWVNPFQRGEGLPYLPALRRGAIGSNLLDYDEFIAQEEKRRRARAS